MAKKILIVEDEETLCEVLRFNLQAAGYDVKVANSAEEALTIDLTGYSLILMDIMMGGISGIELAKNLKSHSETSSLPIIFCTAKSSDDDMVEGLELGADDYITKPFSMRNLLARIEAVLRRTESETTDAEEASKRRLVWRGVVLDCDTLTCAVDDKPVKLPRKEFEILRLLMSNPGKVFTRAELLDRIWPEEVVVVDRVVDVNITRIRKKIQPYDKGIVTRSGYGYILMDN